MEASEDFGNPTPTWSAVAEYLYDGLNRRTKKDLAAGTDIVYLYDGWRCIEERELDGETWEARRQTVHGGRYIDEVLIFDKDTDSDGDCTEGDGNGSKRYLYCENNNFNIVALTHAGGVVAERYQYDPYGLCEVTLNGNTGNMLRFQGRRWDAETGLYYFRNRMLDPITGRFFQRDPLGYVDGMGLYEFAGSYPASCLDPFGMQVAAGPPSDREDYDQWKMQQLMRSPGSDEAERQRLAQVSPRAVTVIIYSTGEGRLTAAWTIGAWWTADIDVGARSVKEAVDQVLVELGPDDSIARLEIWGHGTTASIYIGSDMINASDFDPLTKNIEGSHYNDLARLRARMSRTGQASGGVRVHFAGCSTFRGKEGQKFAKSAASFFDTTVSGFTENIGINQPGYVELEPGQEPAWKVDECEPTKKSKKKAIK